MILVLASQQDPGAAALVAGWAGARLLTPADLSLPGWALAAGPSSGTGAVAARGVADGAPFATDQVQLLVSLLGGVDAAQLGWITEEHREYVASEMTAFLGHWLTTLGSRCLVAPSYASLAGPCPPTATWAAAAGLPLATDRDVDRDVGTPRALMTVVADRVFRVGGSDSCEIDDALARRLCAMAASYDVPLLSAVVVRGAGTSLPRLQAVLPAPVVRTAEVRSAVRGLVEDVLLEEVAS
ncbi:MULTISPECIES: hypothetical protein [unclassified Nocardioides]|uniref:hypothetical protein n=1 Tax=unclassified Nocardioides TaxID=2615069 RepID=UPI0006FB20B7|nr:MULTISPECIES: hypothetical protein [unclassified Nocardioides]KRA29574.1 hypothetical protein ASD81_21635 [Nocardioides sp. Root614]KRA88251.1 hypothetical protein ASD84_19980 [Nocardioides sp. Root682]